MIRRSGSIKLMDAFGIRIGVDASWFLILFLLIFTVSAQFRTALHSTDSVAYLTTVITVLLLFGSLIVHELGHALVARRQGIEVQSIDLFLFGGLTRMSRDARTPGEEFKIAAAGPLATFGFVLVCLVVDLAIVGPHRLTHAAVLDGTVTITPVLLSLSWLLFWNVLLLIFNLVPAFPLDGGRIARAIVWKRTGDKTRGTRVAAKLGQGFAIILGGLGIFWMLGTGSFAGLWLIALAFLIGSAARGALVQSALTERIEGVRVADIMDRQPVAIPGETAVGEAIDAYFLRYGWPWFPVVDRDGRFLGIARQERVQAAIDGGEGWLTVGAVLDAGDADAWGVSEDRPLTEVLASESLGALGAVMAVDRDGMLSGVVTIEQVRRALQSALGSPAS
ncbi:MAG TPA: site-2 protease family protein [Solirubrobacteraceae bacterium]|nr:site-2 protease family protein [Solirubrobacteraceae bacterium]